MKSSTTSSERASWLISSMVSLFIQKCNVRNIFSSATLCLYYMTVLLVSVIYAPDFVRVYRHAVITNYPGGETKPIKEYKLRMALSTWKYKKIVSIIWNNKQSIGLIFFVDISFI